MTTATIQKTAQGLELEESLVGRDQYGERYYLHAAIKSTDRQVITINHETLEPGAPIITMSGHIVSKGCRLWHSGGQNLDQFEKITQFNGRWNKADLDTILSIWGAYHLNDMNSHCAHQDSDIKWDAVEPCSVTGYRAGSSWLYAPIPDSVLISLTGLILANRGR